MKTTVVFAALAALSVAACVQRDGVTFSASVGQENIVRDGRPSIVSQKRGSLVMVSPASREFAHGERPVFTLAATNLTRGSIDLRIANIEVNQRTPSGSLVPLQVITYEQLVSEERTRQVFGAMLVGVVAVSNAAAASQAGHGSYSGTAYTPRGSVSYSGTYYSPTAAAIAQANANATNAVMIASTVERGRANMANLERNVLKDNTILPGEWIGGRIYFAPPVGEQGQIKNYVITVKIGEDVHTIDVSQGPQKNS